ncbi:MAG: GNAT family N-acetyltransferase [Bacteroidetes bacterium]|nr:MAG: GNAT family N-acetyltransferase [Bacteroidota bacterium]
MPSMPPTIRPATTEDIPTIRDLAHCIWWAHYPGIISAEQIEYMLGLMYSVETLQRQIREEGHQFWLVEDEGGTAIGFLAISKQAAGTYFIQKFYLENAEQGKGYGTTVFRQLLDNYPDLQVVRLAVNRQNFKSINFYFKLGFCIEKCVNTSIGQGFVMDDFQMIRKQR